ncbi:hypothetical protein J5N97_008761 [Dioscorea zingiberensis]|uniref:Uncharacterized protein n=1 Tax=Dioscorea zingiberensis TaxID=325984 RepID=A0A9D5HLB6_9LILI|nr:hypothetical protein J5N97_008761 [Dioscorea zingiberensis]
MEKRQVFLRSYHFSRKRTAMERIRRSLVRVRRLISLRLRSARRLPLLVWCGLRLKLKLRRRRFHRLVAIPRPLSCNSDCWPCWDVCQKSLWSKDGLASSQHACCSCSSSMIVPNPLLSISSMVLWESLLVPLLLLQLMALSNLEPLFFLFISSPLASLLQYATLMMLSVLLSL